MTIFEIRETTRETPEGSLRPPRGRVCHIIAITGDGRRYVMTGPVSDLNRVTAGEIVRELETLAAEGWAPPSRPYDWHPE